MLINDDTIRVSGRVMALMAGPTYRVRLSNGYELFAFLSGRQKHRAAEVQEGCDVDLEISAYDLSRGRIALPALPLPSPAKATAGT